MAYKLAEEDKLCGVIYPTYEGFSPIPKVTCDMLESKCEQTIIVKCGEDSTSESISTTTSTSQSSSESTSTSESTSQSVSSSESVSNSESTSVSTSLSTSESTSESVSESSSTENSNTPEEPKPTPEPQPEPTPTPVLTDDEITELLYSRAYPNDKQLGNVEMDALTRITTAITEPTPEELEDFKNTVVTLTGDIEELKGYKVEVIPKKRDEDYPKVGENGLNSFYTFTYKVTKPNGDVYTSEVNDIPSHTSEITQYDKLLPNLDPFSKVITKDGQVVEVPEVTEEEKTSYENKVIEELKKKLPEGTTVEAVLEGANYEKGSEVLRGKTNYDLNVKITKNDTVYEHTYKVPHTEEAPNEEPEAPDENIERIFSNIDFGVVTYDGDLITDIRENFGASDLGNQVKEHDLPRISETLGAKLEEALNIRLTGGNVYKVNDFTVRMNYKVGEHKPWSKSVFSFTAKITKPNGEVVTKEGDITSGAIDTL